MQSQRRACKATERETDVSFKGLNDVGEVYRVLLLVMVMMMMVLVFLLVFCLLCRLLLGVLLGELLGELFGVLRGGRWRGGRLWCATGPRSVAIL